MSRQARDWKTYRARKKVSEEEIGALCLPHFARAVSRKILRWEACSVRCPGGKEKPLLVAILECGHKKFFSRAPNPQPETWGCFKCLSDPPR